MEVPHKVISQVMDDSNTIGISLFSIRMDTSRRIDFLKKCAQINVSVASQGKVHSVDTIFLQI